MAIMLNMAISIDLVLMVRYPFLKKESVLKIYVVVSIIVSSIAATSRSYSYNGYEFSDVHKDDAVSDVSDIGSYIYVILVVIYLMVFTFSIIYTCSKLGG